MSHRGVVVNMLNCDIRVKEFEFLSYYYVRFLINTIGKGMNSLILPGMG